MGTFDQNIICDQVKFPYCWRTEVNLPYCFNFCGKNEMELDKFDHAILDALAADGRISITDLALAIGLSKSPTQARLRRLEASGVIKGYQPIVDNIKLGRDHVAFVEVRLNDTRESSLAKFNAAVVQISEVEECHMLAANFDYLLKVRAHDMRSYRTVLAEKISTLPYVAATSTFVAMQAVKEGGIENVI